MTFPTPNDAIANAEVIELLGVNPIYYWPGLRVLDDFNRANNPSTVNGSPGPFGWVLRHRGSYDGANSVWGITVDGQAYCSANPVVLGGTVFNAGLVRHTTSGDFDMRITLGPLTGSAFTAEIAMFRADPSQDDGHTGLGYFIVTGTQVVRLRSNEGGGSTWPLSITPVEGDLVRIVGRADRIEVYVNGALSVGFNDSYNQTATDHGLSSLGPPATSGFGDFHFNDFLLISPPPNYYSYGEWIGDNTLEAGETSGTPDFLEYGVMTFDKGSAWWKYTPDLPHPYVWEFLAGNGWTGLTVNIYRVPVGTPVTAADPGELVFHRGGGGSLAIMQVHTGYTYYVQVVFKDMGPMVALPYPLFVVAHLHAVVPGDNFTDPLVLPSTATGAVPIGEVQYSTAELGEVMSEVPWVLLPVAGTSWYRWTAPKDGILLTYFSWDPHGYMGMDFFDVQFYGLLMWKADELLYPPKAIRGETDADGHVVPAALPGYDNPFFGPYGGPFDPVGGYKYVVEKDQTYIIGITRGENEADFSFPYAAWIPSTAGFAGAEVNIYWQMLPFPPDLAGDFGNTHTAFTPAGPTP